MKVKIKRLSDKAVIPSYSKLGDAGMDLYAVSARIDDFGNIEYGTGLAIEIPKGYVGLLFSRSSISKKDLTLSNAVGVIDSGYRGEIIFKFKCSSGFVKAEIHNTEDKVVGNIFLSKNSYNLDVYRIGERVGQLIIMPYPNIQFEEVEDLSDSVRGDGGFGSTGK